MRSVLLFPALLAMAVSVFAPLPAHAQAESGARLTISGEGRVVAVPDMAVVTLGAMAQAKTARAAMDETSQITSAILERMQGFGIEARDLQTSDLSLGPIWSKRSDSSGTPRIDGYQASNRVTIRIRDLTRLGEILDAALEDGANRLNGLSFTLQEPKPHLDDARRAAVADARAKAELYTEAAGVRLGRLVSFNEEGGHTPRPMMMEMARASMADAVPVAQGETSITARVHMVYEILQ